MTIKTLWPIALVGVLSQACGSLSKEDRQNLTAYQQNAALYYGGGNLNQALDQCRRGLELDPENYKLLTIRAWCRMRQAKTNPALVDEVIALFDDLMARRSGSQHEPQALLGYALLHQHLGQRQFTQAETLRAEVPKLEQGTPDAAGKLARAAEHESKGKSHLRIAEQTLQQLIEREDELLLAHDHMMQVKALLKDHEAAIRHGLKALARIATEQERERNEYQRTTQAGYESERQRSLVQLVEREIALRGAISNLYFDSGRAELAKEQLDLVLSIDPTRAQDYYNRGRCHEKLGRVAEARKDYQKFLAMTRLPEGHPNVTHAYRALKHE
jgi:tetratricopeptide (TPR) repeat protein